MKFSIIFSVCINWKFPSPSWGICHISLSPKKRHQLESMILRLRTRLVGYVFSVRSRDVIFFRYQPWQKKRSEIWRSLKIPVGSHRIHGTGIFTYMWFKNQADVGKYTSWDINTTLYGTFRIVRIWMYTYNFTEYLLWFTWIMSAHFGWFPLHGS